jgi:hypothetical protein
MPPDVIARGIIMDVIGVGMQSDHTLAKKAHSYRRANDPAALSRALAEVFAEVSNTVTDFAHVDAFDVIAPIPDQVAMAIIQALSASGNHPIGEKPKPSPQPSSINATKAPAASIPVSVPTTAGGNSPPPVRGEGFFSRWGFALMLVLIILAAKVLGKLFFTRKGHRK